MAKSTAHIIAMTGSYFRGDSVPVLLPEDEAKFIKIKYDYYQQLNGYDYLKSLGIGYHFYTGRYFKKHPEKEISALAEILDETQKTIIHIPSVNSAESSKEKYEEVNHIIDVLGVLDYQDEETDVLYIKSHKTGKNLKVADLVNDNPKSRDKISAYLRNINSVDDIDIIIALGMAKGQRLNPREWFVVPFEVIEEAIQLILNENIVNYEYDVKLKKIKLKTN